MRRSNSRLCYGKALYGANSTLPVDFFHCCSRHFNMRLHEETFIGVRSSQQRGLFLSETRPSSLPANSPIVTIPLATLLTASNCHRLPNALPHITLEKVEQATNETEFRIMAPQLLLALQLSAVIASLPDITKAETREETERISAILRSGVAPYARLLDDEDFNEEFVFGMYGMALDSWQRASFEDMTEGLHRTLTVLHERLEPPFKLEHLRRITRLVLARAEHTPPLKYYSGSSLLRQVRRRWRRLCGVPDPYEVSMVPFLDLVNHSNRPNCAIRVGPSPELGGAGAITLFSLREVHPGKELCRHYNFAIDRASALLRYGFLPFDLISIVEHDAIDEYLVKNQDMLKPESVEIAEKRERDRAELQRLEQLYQTAKRSRATGPLT